MTTPTPEQTDAPDEKNVVARLRDACNGHPSTLIPWPHRVLHDAAARIEELEAALAKLDADTHVLVPVEQVEAVNLWLREPDHSGSFTWSEAIDWLENRPSTIIIRAAQEGK